MSTKINQKIDVRMKDYEKAFRHSLMPNCHWVVRLDGRSFSKFTRKMEFKKPFDELFLSSMRETTVQLLKEFNPVIAYTQSDEITLLFKPTHTIFNQRIDKICSVLAGKCSVFFYYNLHSKIMENLTMCITGSDKHRKAEKQMTSLLNNLPSFDCRVFNVPNKDEWLNALIWREQDAIKNSILSVAQYHFSHKEMLNKNTAELVKMLKEKGIFWDDLPVNLKRGTYFIKDRIMVQPTEEEKKENPHLPESFSRTVIKEVEDFSDISVGFFNEKPQSFLKDLTNKKSLLFYD